MKITIKPTPTLLTVDEVPVRLWSGVTGRGNRCTVMVHMIMSKEGRDADLEAELEEVSRPHDPSSLFALDAFWLNAGLMEALEESVKLQSQYAGLLNQYDCGKRIQFDSAADWIQRLEYLRSQRNRAK